MPDTDLHQDVGELRGEMKALRAEFANFRDDFKEANKSIRDLAAAMNKAEGAWAASRFILPAITSAAVSALAWLGLGVFPRH